MTRDAVRTVAALAVGTLAVSAAAPLIRLAALPAVALAAWRTATCGALYAALRPRDLAALRGLGSREWLLLAAASSLLALHFGLWISAFEHTSYASTVLLLVTQPLFGALVGRVAYGERLGAATWFALAGAAGGLALLVHADVRGAAETPPADALLGDALAVLGSLAIALYYVAVRPLRRALPFAPFMAATYGGAGLLLAGAALALGVPLHGYATASWGWLAVLVLLPTAVGHACFNWAVPRVRFFTLNLLIVLEPALALAFGVAFLAERVTAPQVVGGGVLGAAVLVGLRRPPQPPRADASTDAATDTATDAEDGP